jgi:maleate isomerase
MNDIAAGISAPKIRFGWRLRLGMLLPSSNLVAEPEIPAMLPDGVSLHTTRLKLAGGSSSELLAMTEKVEEGAALIADCNPDLIVFHCTAVSTFDPAMEGKLKARIETTTGKRATATSEALIAAFRTFGARKIVLVSPYSPETNAREVAFLAHHQISVLREVGLNLDGGVAFAAVEPDEWYRLTIAHRHPDADAYFLSCTTIRAASVIEALERDLGKPVVTSNQAVAWHSLRMGGVRDQTTGFGALLSLH